LIGIFIPIIFVLYFSLKPFILLIAVLLLFQSNLLGQENSILLMDSVMSDTSSYSLNARFDSLVNNQTFIHDLIIIKKGDEKIRLAENKTGLFFIAFILLACLAGFRQMIAKHLANLFDVFLKTKISKRQLIEQLEHQRQASWILRSIYFCGMAYIIFRFLKYRHLLANSSSQVKLYVICLSSIISLYIIKSILVRLMGWIFEQKEVADNYIFNSNIVSEFAAVFLFPLCVLLLIKSGSFDSFLLNLALVLMVIMFLYRYVRTFGIAKKCVHTSIVHFLLYICAFEIIPIMMCVKLMMKG
jgi:hypothetical protein